MKTGDRVLIESDHRGSDVGRVEALRLVGELPALPDGPPVDLVRDILEEMDIVCLAMISYRDGSLLFCAAETSSGEWYDLQRQRLSIKPIALQPGAGRLPS